MSLTKVVETMKKISRMNTMSIRGEMSTFCWVSVRSRNRIGIFLVAGAENVLDLRQFLSKPEGLAVQQATDDQAGDGHGQTHLGGKQRLRNTAGDAAGLSKQGHVAQ